jgi:hypothetical protein
LSEEADVGIVEIVVDGVTQETAKFTLPANPPQNYTTHHVRFTLD